MITNQIFREAVFKEDAPFVHVTDFAWDPNDIPADEHLRAWRGDWASRYSLRQGTNQYFCISIFNPDEKGIARRRKALFLRTRCIVLDDVREKLDPDQAARLPPPSWILETSPGSEQWGYILTEPCHDRARVENLLDGLVASDLAPSGNDPGMKGVTRYVRLPEGVNTKASKMVEGKPWQCRMLTWEPERTTTLEALAAPFQINLDASRRDGRVDGAANVPDHPILEIPDIVHIKEVRSAGRFDITCPWVDEHTGAIDNGTGIFTNDDGSLGFKCHHGACEGRTARDLIRWVETQVPGWGDRLSLWKARRIFDGPATSTPAPAGTTMPAVTESTTTAATQSFDDVFALMQRQPPGSQEARGAANRFLRAVEDLSVLEQKHWHQCVADHMLWSKKEFTEILKGLRKEWYNTGSKDVTFMAGLLWVKEINAFYEWQTEVFMSTDAMQNSFAHIDPEAKKTALVEGAVEKVDKVDFAPGKALIFMEDGVRYGNLWVPTKRVQTCRADVTPWLRHIDVMGWGKYKKHLLQWMAFTLRHPEIKINHMLVLAGYEGSGKDFIIYPVVWAEHYATVIHSDELMDSNFNEYLFATKLLVVNEGDTAEWDRSNSISNRLKPLAAAPPEKIRVNRKNIAPVKIRNLVSVIMTTNSQLPVKLQGTTRRMFAIWSDLTCRDETTMEMLPAWREYWEGMWHWMMNGGREACAHYLYNEVDLSDFNPGAAPPMTDFLREMQESSKTLQQQTVEAFIRNRVGAFAADLININDAVSTLRAGQMYPDFMYCDPAWFTPERVNRIFKNVDSCTMIRGANLWAIRASQNYLGMSDEAIREAYGQQLKQIKSGKRLEIC